MNPERLRIGIVGAGAIAREHSLSLRASVLVEKLLYFDADAVRARQLADEFQGECLATLDQLIEACDIVWICTPPFARRAAIEAACAARRPLFCEKPLALSATELEWVEAMIAASGVPFFMGQSNRFAAFFQKMKALVEEGAIGAVTKVWSSRLGWLDPQKTPAWRMDDGQGGGTLIELGVHEIDFMRWVGGEWQAVYAQSPPPVLLPGQFQDTVTALGTFQNGATASLNVSWASPRYLWQRGVEGTTGSLFFDDSNIRQIELHRAHAEPEFFPVEWEPLRPGENPSLRFQADAVLGSLINGQAPPVSLHDGAQAIRIALAMRESVASRQCVEL